MTSLTGDIINRVKRLPKPSNAAEALQPLFEAVSNGMHAIEDAVASQRAAGHITVDVGLAKNPSDVTIMVSDNGVGLDPVRYSAFLTTDTDFKSERGGKGIGRLLWLDAFDRTSVESVFADGDKMFKRKFDFLLDRDDQVQNEVVEEVQNFRESCGTTIRFYGLRERSYAERFPAQAAAIIRHFGSHFLAEFIMDNAPNVSVNVGDQSANFPRDIRDMLIEDRGSSEEETEDFGVLNIKHFIFRSTASSGFDGNHQLHLIANGRTVMTRKIDGLVGVGRFGSDGRSVYHGCISGKFLDDRVNQERTHFNFDEEVAVRLTKICAEVSMRDALANEVRAYDGDRLTAMEEFLSDYPSFHFAEAKDLLEKTPKNATKAEQFAQSLVATRIRRDLERKKRVQEIVSSLCEGSQLSEDFAEKVKEAADDVRAEEQRQLTEYVLRRRIVLDVLDVLIRRLRNTDSGEQDYHLEKTLHQFICPMRVRGDDPSAVEATDHDLWIIDERLAFSRYFASDVTARQITKNSSSSERPDLFIWDRIHGLGYEKDEPLRRVMLVEFKRPGRKEYDDDYAPANQIARYLNALSNGEIEGYRNERVRIAEDCVFYCYVIADIVGSLDVYTSTWRTTADGRGRWTELSGKFRGSIEVIEWRDLLSDARDRNAAFIQFAR